MSPHIYDFLLISPRPLVQQKDPYTAIMGAQNNQLKVSLGPLRVCVLFWNTIVQGDSAGGSASAASRAALAHGHSAETSFSQLIR